MVAKHARGKEKGKNNSKSPNSYDSRSAKNERTSTTQKKMYMNLIALVPTPFRIEDRQRKIGGKWWRVRTRAKSTKERNGKEFGCRRYRQNTIGKTINQQKRRTRTRHKKKLPTENVRRKGETFHVGCWWIGNLWVDCFVHEYRRTSDPALVSHGQGRGGYRVSCFRRTVARRSSWDVLRGFNYPRTTMALVCSSSSGGGNSHKKKTPGPTHRDGLAKHSQGFWRRIKGREWLLPSVRALLVVWSSTRRFESSPSWSSRSSSRAVGKTLWFAFRNKQKAPTRQGTCKERPNYSYRPHFYVKLAENHFHRRGKEPPWKFWRPKVNDWILMTDITICW